MLRVYLPLSFPFPPPVLSFSPWKKEPALDIRDTLLPLQRAARLCVLKSSSGPSLADRKGGLGHGRVNPKGSLRRRGEKKLKLRRVPLIHLPSGAELTQHYVLLTAHRR